MNNLENIRRGLLSLDVAARLKELSELYKHADVFLTPQLPRILEALFPVFQMMLRTQVPPQFVNNDKNRCRKLTLQILNRLPYNEALKPYASRLLHLLMEVLTVDNVDNCLIALKTIFDLHRNYRPGLKGEVQPFLEQSQKMYKSIQLIMKKQFSGPAEPPLAPIGSHAPSSTETPAPAPSLPPADTTKDAPDDPMGAADDAAEETKDDPMGEAKPAPTTLTVAPPADAAATPAPAPTTPTNKEVPLCPGVESFKTMAEFPLIIMLLFQCYPNYIENYIPILVPLMMSTLSLRCPELAPKLYPTKYVDFLDCQVKTLSFVTYLLRGFALLMRPFQDTICENTVKLLMACPKDAFVLRKDVFVAARHILSTDFRRGFYGQLEVLMDDDVLIGKGRCSYYQIRPLAYSTLADMIHHVRDMLTLDQVSKIVAFYGKRIHDPTLPVPIQTTAIRLLLNLVDISAKNEDADGWRGRNILSRILLTIATKFGTTLHNLPIVLSLTTGATTEKLVDPLEGGAMDKIKQSDLVPHPAEPLSEVDAKLKSLLAPYEKMQRSYVGLPEEEPTLRDVKSLLRTMILGIRAVIWCTANYRNPHAKDLTTMDTSGSVSSSASEPAEAHAYPLTDDERGLIAKVLQNGLRCFILYTLSDSSVSEEKQMLDHFAGAFTVLDAADFRDLFLSNMKLLYECILQDHAILTVPQHFLANANVSCWFAEILLTFLVTRMDVLGVACSGDVPDLDRRDKICSMTSLVFEKMRPVAPAHEASIVLRLFKIVFGSVTLFKANESALFPHLKTIIVACLTKATHTTAPDNYLLLLRALFRSISGVKFENFYKEVLPLLPGLLSALMRLQQHIQKPSLQDVLLELCLTIPARLSSLLQYLPSLMRSVVQAMLSKGELANLGLRTLEYWVDNLNPDFLYPIMTSQERLLTEIIEALNTHLHPPPYPYGELAMRILGKIGGRNRQFTSDELCVEHAVSSLSGLVVDVRWEKDTVLQLPLDAHVDRACCLLRDFTKRHDATKPEAPPARVDAAPTAEDSIDDGGELANMVLEKDEKTLLLEAETVDRVKRTVLEQKTQAFAFVKAALAAQLQLATLDLATLANVAPPSHDEATTKTIAAELDECFSATCNYAAPAKEPVAAEQEVLKRLLRTLFESATDVDLAADARPLVRSLCIHIATLVLSRSRRTLPNPDVLRGLTKAAIVPGPRGLSPGRMLGTSARIEVYREAFYGLPVLDDTAPRSLDPFVLFEVLVDVLADSDDKVVAVGTWALGIVLETVTAVCGDDDAGQAGALLNGLCEICTHACYDKGSWRHKLGGARGLGVLIDQLQVEWCRENEMAIVRCLLFVLADHPAEVTAGVSVEAGTVFLKLLRRCHEPFAAGAKLDDLDMLDLIEETKPADPLHLGVDLDAAPPSMLSDYNTEVLLLLVSELLSASTPVRRYAKEAVDIFAAFTGVPVASLLQPYQHVLAKQIMGTSLRLLSLGTRTGYIDGMAYCLTLDPPLFALNKDLLLFLQEVWNLVTEDSAGSPTAAVASALPTLSENLSGQEYPFGLSQMCQLRIAAIQLLRAAFVNDDLLQQHQEACNRFVGVFFKFLTGQPSALLDCAQQALTDVILMNKRNNERSLSKELLQQCLRPVLLNLADYRKLTIPLLEGLGRLLGLLSSCFNVTLGEKLLEHLRQWRDPERIIKAAIWKRGEEPNVAAAIVDLFHLLPPSDTFLDPLVSCVVELEAVLPKYGSFGKLSSPYRKPLVRFLNRYAAQAVAFFLKREHLVDSTYAALFQQLIKLPAAQPLRAVLVSDSGTEAIIAATFAQAVKSPAATPASTPRAAEEDEPKTAAQIQLQAAKAASQAIAQANAQGLSASAAEHKGKLARAAYLAKHAPVPKPTSQVQIQAAAQKLHAQTVAAAQAQGLSLVQAQARAQQVMKEYISKHLQMASPMNVAASTSLAAQQQQAQLQAQIQVNAQKVHAQALATAKAQGLKLADAQERAKQAQSQYVQIAKQQAQAKMALQQKPAALASPISSPPTPSGPYATKAQQEALELHYQGLRLVRTLCKLEPAWLGLGNGMIECLRRLWRSPARVQRLHAQDRLPIRFHMESKLLVKCLMQYSRAKPEDVQVLLDMLPVFLHRTAFDFSFLRAFYRDEVAAAYPTVHKRAIIHLFLRMLRDAAASEELKVHAIQLLIMPLLHTSFDDPETNNAEVMDPDAVMLMLREILASKDYPQDTYQALRIELLKLGTLLIQHMSRYVTDHRKEVIKFAWNHLKAQDLTSKLWAYVNVCRFISVYDTPPKIVLQVYVALLRTYELDSRFLVRKAFDILLPALPTRLPPHEFIKAIKWTKKIAFEEGHILQQLVHIWYLIVRQPSLFYPFRGQFIPLMVNSLNRLAIPPSSTQDNRRLAVSVVDLVIAWEMTRRQRVQGKEIPSKKRAAEDEDGEKRLKTDEAGAFVATSVAAPPTAPTTAPSAESEAEAVLLSEDDFELTGAMTDLIVNFAFRFALACADKQETNRLSKTCGELFHRALHLWPSASIRFSYFDKLIAVTAEVIILHAKAAPPTDGPVTAMPSFLSVHKSAPLASLAILHAVLGILNTLISPEVIQKSNRAVPYVVQYAPRIMKLLEPCFDRQNNEVQHQLTLYLTHMVQLYPPEKAPPQLVACKFYTWLRDILNERILKAAAVPVDATLPAASPAGAVNSPTNPLKAKTKPTTSKPEADPLGSPAKGQSALNPMINHEAARMRLLFANSPHAALPSRLSSPGAYILKILSELAPHSTKFIDLFAPSLIKLAQRLTKEHLQHVVSIAKPASSLEGSIGGTDVGVSAGAHSKDRVMATPSLAIAHEYLQLQQGRSALTVNNTVRTKKAKDESKGAKKKLPAAVSSPKDPKALAKPATAPLLKKRAATPPHASTVAGRKVFMDMLIWCFKLLAACTFESSELARMFVHLMAHCLEHSSHIPLLLEITKIVAKMVADDAASAIPIKDKVTLLGKMASFDRLNEISAQPLLAEYHALVLAICASAETNPLYPTVTGAAMTGLLSSDVALRRQFFAHFEKSAGATTTAKLRFVLEQDWQACGTRFWPVVAVELLLKSVQPGAVVAHGARLPPLVCSTAPVDALTQMPCWAEHVAVLTAWRDVSSDAALRPLCSLVHVDLAMATALWATVFPQAWALLNPMELAGPTQNLMRLLSMRYHRRELRVPVATTARHNVVQTLMAGVVQAYPMPVLTAELLLYLANTYNVWGLVARVVEYEVLSPTTLVDDRERWVDVLHALYSELNERDWLVGLGVQACQKPETRMALHLQAQGYVHEAQDVYFQALSQTSKALKIEASAFELKVLETQWISCVNHLCQWSLLHDFAKATQNQELLLDCCWKRGDWATAKQLLHAPSIQAASEAGSPSLRLKKLYVAILDGDKKPQVDSLTSQMVDLTLHQWQGLPRLLSNAHIPLLHLFQQFVEAKESLVMMADIKIASAAHNLPNLKPSINTWRERLPNKHEPVLLWDDILTWRAHMFSVIKSTFSWSDPQLLASLHDSPWSIVKMAHTARKQQLPDVCLHALAQLYTIPAMDVQDAFSKLREQVSICYETTKEFKGGLSLLNNTNLDYFDARQKAELFRLKALFLDALGDKTDANVAFSHCLQLCDSYGKGWLSWGQYCDALYSERGDIDFAAQTIACFLQAVHHRSSSARLYLARVLWLLSMDNENGVLIQAFETHGKQLPIWIWIVWIPQLLMSLCRPEAPQIRGLLRGLSAKFPQALYYTMRAFFLENRELLSMDKEKHLASAPPTPLASAQTTPKGGFAGAGDFVYYRTKSGHVVAVPMTHEAVAEIPGLVGASRSTPSFFGPSTTVLSLDGWLEKVAAGELLKLDMSPLQYTEDLLNFLRRSHDTLAWEMECMLEEMIVRFRPEPEEELLTAVHALLLKCYQLPSFAKTEAVPKMLRDTLSRVCSKFFVLQPHQKSDKHLAFVTEFKGPFEAHFMLADDGPPTLAEVMDRLKLWKHVLQLRVKRYGQRNADKVFLEHSSRHLAELRQTAVEIPGQYLTNAEPIKELHARLAYFHSSTDVLLRNGYTQRRITLGGNNGKHYSFLVQYAMTYITRCDERMMQMHLLVNRLFLRHKETKQRNLVLHIPKVIPLTPRVRLMEDNVEHISLGEIYELDCAVQQKDPDLPVELYRRKISEVEENMANMKLAIFNEICDQHVSEHLLAKYLHRTIPHADDLFQFRNVFASHLALTSFLSYALHVGERTPHKVVFSRATGRVVSCEVRPNYGAQGNVEAGCTMPFRLTRNLQAFVTSTGVEGPFTVAMAAAAQALSSDQHEAITRSQLQLFFRDDLLSWNTSKTKTRFEHTHAETHRRGMAEHSVRSRVDANVQAVTARIAALAPKPARQMTPSAPTVVAELIATATNTEGLSQIYPTWFPWL
ncbi:phosphatidylinositol kinase (PIK-L3) [Achlya hypogyna]|uniref:Phosphatidylinositol kinase (PIK-L3) n=1 Tax=Achlya hypogyna TaxID=1202772 RepID=A0A1V9ZEG8_ACHHY|nr:phosphatidylinositol kinase (PIK-L3) [Achlya hypogyna]